MTERRVTLCRSCDGPSENSILGMLLVKKHGSHLASLGVVHRPWCSELAPKPCDVFVLNVAEAPDDGTCLRCGKHRDRHQEPA